MATALCPAQRRSGRGRHGVTLICGRDIQHVRVIDDAVDEGGQERTGHAGPGNETGLLCRLDKIAGLNHQQILAVGKITRPLQVIQVIDVHPVTGNVLNLWGVAILHQAVDQLRYTTIFKPPLITQLFQCLDQTALPSPLTRNMPIQRPSAFRDCQLPMPLI